MSLQVSHLTDGQQRTGGDKVDHREKQDGGGFNKVGASAAKYLHFSADLAVGALHSPNSITALK